MITSTDTQTVNLLELFHPNRFRTVDSLDLHGASAELPVEISIDESNKRWMPFEAESGSTVYAYAWPTEGLAELCRSYDLTLADAGRILFQPVELKFRMEVTDKRGVIRFSCTAAFQEMNKLLTDCLRVASQR